MAVKKQIKFFGFVIYSLYFIRKCIYSRKKPRDIETSNLIHVGM